MGKKRKTTGIPKKGQRPAKRRMKEIYRVRSDSGTPFMGEKMICAMSGRQENSHPGVESGWTTLDLDNWRYYVSPQWLHPRAEKVGYEKAYNEILTKLMAYQAHMAATEDV